MEEQRPPASADNLSVGVASWQLKDIETYILEQDIQSYMPVQGS